MFLLFVDVSDRRQTGELTGIVCVCVFIYLIALLFLTVAFQTKISSLVNVSV